MSKAAWTPHDDCDKAPADEGGVSEEMPSQLQPLEGHEMTL